MAEHPEPGHQYQKSGIVLMHSFDHGSIHIDSKDPTASPDIDLNILTNETDINILVKAYRILQAIHSQEPLKSIIDCKALPGKSSDTDEALIEYIKKSVFMAFHPLGTTSMLPFEDGGCVDNQLKVYGTEHLCVVSSIVS
ncbi:Choline dehydrogenase [Termitomyces sp. J132]|nr:Choline dehydrogenase [Termitomyces sp. J132]